MPSQTNRKKQKNEELDMAIEFLHRNSLNYSLDGNTIELEPDICFNSLNSLCTLSAILVLNPVDIINCFRVRPNIFSPVNTQARIASALWPSLLIS